MGRVWAGGSHSLIWDSSLASAWKDWGEPQKQGMTLCVPAEIQTVNHICTCANTHICTSTLFGTQLDGCWTQLNCVFNLTGRHIGCQHYVFLCKCIKPHKCKMHFIYYLYYSSPHKFSKILTHSLFLLLLLLLLSATARGEPWPPRRSAPTGPYFSPSLSSF